MGDRTSIFYMKTLELKVILTKNQEDFLLKSNAPDLAWAWNLALELLIEDHTINYYGWLAKKASESNISLDGIDLCCLSLSKKSGWSLPMKPDTKRMEELLTKWEKDKTYKYFGLGGHSCRIAYIDKSGKYTPIEKRLLPSEPRLIAHLKPGKDGTKRMGSSASSIYMTLSGCLTIEKCSKIREERGLPKLTLSSSYLKGTLNRLATSWAAYVDVKRRDAHIPKFKKEPVSSFFCVSPENIKLKNNKLILPGLTGGIIFVNNNHLRIENGSDIRSAVIKKEPSGWYVCLTVASSLEVELRTVKKEIKSTKDEDTKADLKQQVNQLETALYIHESHKAGIKKSDKAVGIDPGVKALIATDKGTLIKPNAKAEKREKRIQRLQRKLSRQTKHGKNFKKTSQQLAKQHEVNRRSRSAYQHKISTYLVRTFGAIAWEETQHNNINKRPKAKLRADGNGYERNGAKRKAGLNRALANAGMGGLREKTKNKMETLRGKNSFLLTKPHYSSKLCHSCGTEGDRPSQTDFYCKNPKCKLFGIKQQADVNAARNHLLRSSFLESGEYRLWDWYEAHQENTSLGSGEFKPDGEILFSGDSPLSETENSISKSVKQEAEAIAASSVEYADQLTPQKGNKARKGGCKKPKSAKTTSKLDTVSDPNLDNKPDTRAPCTSSISPNSVENKIPKTKKKKRSAQSSSESFTQLTIWDTAGEISFE